MSLVKQIKAPLVDGRDSDAVIGDLGKLVSFYVPEWKPPPRSADDALQRIFAHLTQTVISRLDRVPGKHYVSFLDKIGIRPLPAQYASVPVTFMLSDGTLEQVSIPKGTRVAAGELYYETRSTITAVPAKLMEAVSVNSINGEIFKSPPNIVKGEAVEDFKTYLLYDTQRMEDKIYVAAGDGFSVGDLIKIGGTELQCEYAFIKEIDENAITLKHPLGTLAHHASAKVEKITGFKLFSGKNEQEQILYLGHPELFTAAGAADIYIETDSPETAALLSNQTFMQWEFWGESNAMDQDGKTQTAWFSLQVVPPTERVPKRFNLIKNTAAAFRETAVNNVKSRWIRCRNKVMGAQKALNYLKTGVALQGAFPQAVFGNSDAADLTLAESAESAGSFKTPIYPFGTRPRTFDVFYIGSNEIFSRKGENIVLTFDFHRGGSAAGSVFLGEVTEVLVADAEPSTSAVLLSATTAATAPELKLTWEYWNGNGWLVLQNLTDNTDRFLVSGQKTVLFDCPADIAVVAVNGQENLWIRVKISGGDYGSEVYVNTGTAAAPVFEANAANIKPPIITKLTLSSSTPTDKMPFPRACLTYNNLEYSDRLTELREIGKTFLPFHLLPDVNNSLYLAFDVKPQKGPVSLFIALKEQLANSGDPNPRVLWQYYNRDKGWQKLQVEDETKGLTRTGTVSFVFADGFHNTRLLGRAAWWIRATVTQETAADIEITGLYLNTAWAQETVGGESGNVAGGAVKDLKSSIPFVDKAVNPLPAGGGSNSEALNETLMRGPLTIRHRNRAVTCEDYENLASASSRAVARSRCLPNISISPYGQSRSPGTINVIVVPRSTDAKPKLSLQLQETVETYLAARAPFVLVQQEKLKVLEPLYIEVSVTAVLNTLSPELITAVEALAADKLPAFLHPLSGGIDGCGWEMGRLPCLSDLYRLLEGIAGVDHVASLSMQTAVPQATGTSRQFVLMTDNVPEFSLPPHGLVCSGEHKVTAAYETI